MRAANHKAQPLPKSELYLVTPQQPSAALEALKALDPDELSAREALDRIYQLKQKLDDDS
ncbi:MAG: hypothetical protein CM15mP84_02340 [Cellvibrionales bacterium]|nr:MAG: hypothetical protein CM15mP84_02340 [Cellvibrionales bacterium]